MINLKKASDETGTIHKVRLGTNDGVFLDDVCSAQFAQKMYMQSIESALRHGLWVIDKEASSTDDYCYENLDKIVFVSLAD